MNNDNEKDPSRRVFLTGAGAAAGVVLASTLAGLKGAEGSEAGSGAKPQIGRHNDMAVMGECESGTLDPGKYLTHFSYGKETDLGGGKKLRDYTIIAVDKEIEIAPSLFFPAWTYALKGAPGGLSGHVPGPTLRCTEGDRIRIKFINQGSHPHTIHFHGYHSAEMDGSMRHQFVHPGEEFLYEFDAYPFGLHLYHCHSIPLKRHIHKGLYGVFIIDPPKKKDGSDGRKKAKEFVMVMNGFDTNFDGDNEVYALNSVAHHHMRHPIQVKVKELIRIYLVNITEFDPVNSFHLHANFFYENRTGTKLKGETFTDTVMMCQGERSILEIEFPKTGMYMFHAHQSEFAELGWMGNFNVTES